MWKSAAVAMLATLMFSSCSQAPGLSTDPSEASTCAELADIGINHLQVFIDEAVGDQSYEDFVAAFEADGGEAFNGATLVYSEASLALDARRADVGCPDGEFRVLLCTRLEAVEMTGTAADQLLEPSRAACG